MASLSSIFYKNLYNLASTIGSALSGKLLKTKPMFNSGELMNYSLCFIIAIVLKILSLIWAIVMIDERIAKKQQGKVEMKMIKSQDSLYEESQANQSNKNDRNNENTKPKHPLKMLCDLSNIKDMFLCCVKPRPNRVRTQIWLLLVCKFISSTLMSGQQFTFQFVQKVYHWDSVWFAYVKSLTTIASLIASFTVLPFIIKILKVKDIPLALIGFTTKFISELLIGTILIDYVYYAAILINCLSLVQSKFKVLIINSLDSQLISN